MTIKEYNPKSDLLKKYIKSFYFMKSDTNKKTEFIYYPHFIETINIFSNSTVKISNDSFMVEKDQTNNSIILSATKTKFRTAVVNDEYDIIIRNELITEEKSFDDLQSLQILNNNVNSSMNNNNNN